MFRRLTRIVSSFLAVVAMYWLYALVAVPLIEPRAQARTQIELTPEEEKQARNSGQRHRNVFAKYFKAGDWELEGNPKVLESAQAKLLVQDYHNLPDGRVKLYPCTMLFFPNPGRKNAAGDEQAIVMKAPEGAILQFDEPFDLRKAKVGKLIGGQLVGKVTIQSAPPRPDSPDDLFIVTRDVELIEDRVWTPHPVEFRLGKHRGSGREMKINLAKTDDTASSKKPGAQFGNVESFELARDVKLHMQMEPGAGKGKGNALFGPRDDGDAPATADSQKPEPPIEVTCQGPFKFDVPRSLATFTDQVDVLRINPTGPSDQMNCELLAIQFGPRERPSKKAKPSAADDRADDEDGEETAKPKPRSNQFDIEPRRLEAVGDPVVIRAPSQGGHARCQRLEYEIKTGRIVLEGSEDILLHQGLNEIRTKRFDYRPGESGRLGWLFAAGPGWLQGAAQDNPNQKYQASWATELRMTPQEQLQVVSLRGEAKVRYSEMGALAADEIHVWLLEAQNPGLGPRRTAEVVQANYAPGSTKESSGAGVQGAVLEQGAPTNTVTRASKPKSARTQIVPDRMLAEGNVSIDSPQLTGGTRRLEVAFTQTAPVSAGATSGTPQQSGGSSGGGQGFGHRANTQSFDVRGDLLRLQLLMQQNVARVNDVTVEGGARFVETKTAKPDEKPLVVQGDRLHVAQADSDEAQVNVAGKPATVEARGLTLVGGKIQLDRSTNRLWIDGPGRMKLPMDRDLSGNALDERQTMDIDWQGGMQFDGKTVIYDRAVTARGEHQSLKAENIEVTLRKKVDFANPQLPADNRDAPPAARPKGTQADSGQVEQVTCRGGVTIQNRSFDTEGQVSIDQMQMRDITINQVTGAINGRGPGWITTVRRGAPANAAALGGQPATPPATPTDANANANNGKYTFLNVRFEQTISGNVQRQELTFADQVRTVYGPVNDWSDHLDPDTPDELGPQAVLLNCDQLTVRQMPAVQRGQRATAELEAVGNTLVEGQTFTARAHRLTFAEAKDLLVLEGDGGSDAQLFRQTRPGGPTSQAAARRIMYWRSTNRVEVDDARFLDFGQLQGGDKKESAKPNNGLGGALGNGVMGPTTRKPSRPSHGNGTALPNLKRK